MHRPPHLLKRLLGACSLLGFGLVNAHAAAAPTASAALTLAQALEEAPTTAPSLQHAQALRLQSVWQRRRVVSTFLPKLELFASHLFAYKFYQMAIGNTPTDNVVSIKPPNSELGGALNWSLFDGMQNIYAFKAAQMRVGAATHGQDWAAFTLQQDVRFRFHQVLAAELIEQAAAQNIDTLVSHSQQVKSLRAQGAATDFDVLRVEVQLEDARVNLLQAEDRRTLSRRRLAQVMGYEDDARPLVGTLPRPDAAALARIEAVSEQPQNHRMDLQALARAEQAHDYLRRAAQSFWIPKVEFSTALSTYNSFDRSLAHASLFKRAYSVGVRVQWNIFDGLASLAEAGEQEALRSQVLQQRRTAELEQSYAITQAKRDFAYATAQLHARESNVQRAAENVRLARSGLANGSRDSTDVLDAEQDLFASKAGAIEALLAIEEARIHLHLALGTQDD